MQGGEAGVGAGSISRTQERAGTSYPKTAPFENTMSKSALPVSQPRQPRKISHEIHGGVGSRGNSRVRTLESSPAAAAGASSLTEGNIAKMLGGMNEDGCRADDRELGWTREIGAVERVWRHMTTRHGERVARQARIANVTRTLMQAL